MDYYTSVLKPNMIFLDTIGGLPLVECYDPRHPLTRTGTREQRLNIMRVATNAKLVLGVEAPPQDWKPHSWTRERLSPSATPMRST